MTLAVRIKLPWWALSYVASCAVFGKLFCLTPDVEKICERIMRYAKFDMIDNG